MYNYTLVHSCMHVHIQEGGDREIIINKTKIPVQSLEGHRREAAHFRRGLIFMRIKYW